MQQSSNRTKKLLIAAAGLLAVAGGVGYFVLVGTGLLGGRPTFERKWDFCETGDSCVPVLGPCGRWSPVNEKYLDDATAYYDHLITVVETTELSCPWGPVPDFQPRAYCLSGFCTLAQ